MVRGLLVELYWDVPRLHFNMINDATPGALMKKPRHFNASKNLTFLFCGVAKIISIIRLDEDCKMTKLGIGGILYWNLWGGGCS